MVAYAVRDLRVERKSKDFSVTAWITAIGLVGAFVVWISSAYFYPSAVAIVSPQTFVFDPMHNQVRLNDEVIGRLSEIDEFIDQEGEVNGRGGYAWCWFGVKLKGGGYYLFVDGAYSAFNLGPLAAYMNQFLKDSQNNTGSRH